MDEIRKHFGISDTTMPIGEGTEAVVYALDDKRVLKVYKLRDEKQEAMLVRMKDFYMSLDRSAVPFDIPEIYTVEVRDGVTCTIDKRLHGTDYGALYDTLGPEDRRTSLRNYIQAAEQLHNLAPSHEYFGEVLADDPIREDTWSGFLLRKIRSIYGGRTAPINNDIPDLAEIVAFMEGQLPLFDDVTRTSLVHGDYYVPNVLVDNMQVTAVIDFNNLTLAGDYKMDIASAAIFIDEGVKPGRDEDKAFVISDLVVRYGSSIRDIIHFYELYYALSFAAHNQDPDSPIYHWAVTTLRRHLSATKETAT